MNIKFDTVQRTSVNNYIIIFEITVKVIILLFIV